MEHLFCESPVSVTLFMQIKTWCNNVGMKLPDMNYSNIIIGALPCTGINMLINHIINIFNQILFYNRDKSFTLTLSMFQIRVSEIETIEHNIAVKMVKHIIIYVNGLDIYNFKTAKYCKKEPNVNTYVKTKDQCPINCIKLFVRVSVFVYC